MARSVIFDKVSAGNYAFATQIGSDNGISTYFHPRIFNSIEKRCDGGTTLLYICILVRLAWLDQEQSHTRS